MSDITTLDNRTDNLFNRIAELIEQSRQQVAMAINVAEVYTKYEIGHHIIENEQQGKARAGYGKGVLKELSARLTERFGSGWSVETLDRCRKFYSVYSSRKISSTPQTKLPDKNSATPQRNSSTMQTNSVLSHDAIPSFSLSWNHYQVLMRIQNPDERNFYEIESRQQQWSVRQLKRQVGSSLYERLALSRDKDEVMRLAREGQTVEKPSDIIKNPITLEFLGLKPDVTYTESNLENAIINKLQQFLLELGKGFLFEARQKRFTFEERNFYVDLVFYNRLLQCYVLIDLKTGDLTHQDLGQMQMYVNYYNRHVRQDFEKPTIGILLCETANNSMVELTLPEDANIYAQQYTLYLPDKTLLQNKLREWVAEFNEKEDGK